MRAPARLYRVHARLASSPSVTLMIGRRHRAAALCQCRAAACGAAPRHARGADVRSRSAGRSELAAARRSRSAARSRPSQPTAGSACTTSAPAAARHARATSDDDDAAIQNDAPGGQHRRRRRPDAVAAPARTPRRSARPAASHAARSPRGHLAALRSRPDAVCSTGRGAVCRIEVTDASRSRRSEIESRVRQQGHGRRRLRIAARSVFARDGGHGVSQEDSSTTCRACTWPTSRPSWRAPATR